MFHRVSPQQNSDSATEAAVSAPVSESSSSYGRERPMAQPQQQPQAQRQQVPPTYSSPVQQQKENRTMNAESPENKPAAQGGYQPTPAQPQPSRMDIPGSRPAMPQAGLRTPSAPGMYQPAPSSATAYGIPSSASTESKAATDNKKLVIGTGITLSGEIEDCFHLVVEGTVEAALKGASVLEINESGAFYGTVEIDEARIAGRFEGDLTVRGRLTIEASGSITGAVAYKELAVEAGATLDGKVTPLSAKGDARVTEGNFGKGKAKKANTSFAQADNELPFSDKAAANAAE